MFASSSSSEYAHVNLILLSNGSKKHVFKMNISIIINLINYRPILHVWVEKAFISLIMKLHSGKTHVL